MTRTRLVLAAVACAALVAHLLFIPYAYAPLSFGEGLQRFAEIRWHQLGSDQNVALVSRALMFFPLGLLLAACVVPLPRRRLEGSAFLVACFFGCAWALAVNFAQVWFPARTVNLNNVAAEFLGVAAGGLFWSVLGRMVRQWWRQLSSGGHFSLRAALNAYVVFYLAASLMPFDFAVSARDLAEKTASNLYGLWVAPVGCGQAPCELKFLSMLVATLPCGWWFAERWRGRGSPWLQAAIVGVVAAFLIEVLHFFMVSGVSQGASVLMRAVGMAAGSASYSWRQRFLALDLDRYGRAAAMALLAPYLVAVAYVAGWFRAQPLSLAAGLERANEVVWLPFFHQYYAPYTATMSSGLVHFALYAPVGLFCWLWTRQRGRVPLSLAAVLAVALALIAETSKVFLLGRVPDYTDVFIAALAATVALGLLRFLSRSGSRADRRAGNSSGMTAAAADASASPTSATRVGESIMARAFGWLLIALALWTAIDFPIAKWALFLGLASYAAMLFRFPLAYLIAVPAMLPALDLAPFSGRFYWGEFDALLAVTVGVRLVMPLPMRREHVALPMPALVLLGLSILASTVVGLMPPDPLDANAFTNYLSHYNALRIARGYLWGGALAWLIWRDATAGRDVSSSLHRGLALGLLAAVIGVMLERLSFVGSADVSAWFRAGGFISATHTGGAYLEGLLVGLAPYGLLAAVSSRHSLTATGWYGLAVLGAYAVLATLSRTAAAAWILSVVVFIIVWWVKSRAGKHVVPAGRYWAVGSAIVGVLAAAISIAALTHLRERFAASREDLAVRTAHWGETLGLMKLDPLHALFGAGLGSFPRDYYVANAISKELPAYRVERDTDTGFTYLALLGGNGMYMDQRVAVIPGERLVLTGRVRGSPSAATLSVSLCRKSFLNSVQCDSKDVPAGPAWQPFTVALTAPASVGLRFAWPESYALTLRNGVFGTRTDVTGLSLAGPGGNVLGNGSFEQKLDRWFVFSDNHLAWRTKNTPLQVAYEQGLVGVLAALMLIVAVAGAITNPRIDAGSAAALAGAVVALALVGCFDTLFDSPRLILLVGLILCSGLVVTRPTASRR